MRTAKFEEIGLAIGVILFAGLNYLVQIGSIKMLMNGSGQYLPALLMLFIFGFWCSKKAIDGSKEFFTAAIIFSVSVACRSLDLLLCIQTDYIGTHFIWHILNGFVLYLVIKGLIKSSR